MPYRVEQGEGVTGTRRKLREGGRGATEAVAEVEGRRPGAPEAEEAAGWEAQAAGTAGGGVRVPERLGDLVTEGVSRVRRGPAAQTWAQESQGRLQGTARLPSGPAGCPPAWEPARPPFPTPWFPASLPAPSVGRSLPSAAEAQPAGGDPWAGCARAWEAPSSLGGRGDKCWQVISITCPGGLSLTRRGAGGARRDYRLF